MIRQPRPLPLIIFSVLSALFMLWTFDSFEWSPFQYVFRVAAGAVIALAVELLVLALIVRKSVSTVTRSRWLLEYLSASATGSAALIAWFELAGLTQDRATFVIALVFVTRAINIWLLAYLTDQVSEYRENILSTRAELIPNLLATQQLNSLVETATKVRDQRDIELIRQEVWYPMLHLQHHVRELEDELAAAEVEMFIDQHLRPLAHQVHPITLSRGIIPALRSLDFVIDADDSIQTLDTESDLVDTSARIEVFRWLQAVEMDADVPTTVEITSAGAEVRFAVHDARCGDLDSLHRVAGLREAGARTILAPRAGVEQPVLPAPEPPISASNWLLRRTLLDDWQWSPASIHPRLILILALTAGAVPSIAFIASPRVTASSFIAPAAWIVIPVLIALALRALPAMPAPSSPPARPPQGSRYRQSIRFVATWLAFGILSGLLVATLEVTLVPDFHTDVVWQEVARGLTRITLLGGAVTLAAELAWNARRASTDVRQRLTIAHRHRDALLAKSQRKAEFIAQIVHRRIQGRMSAIALLFRAGESSRAITELEALTATTLPDLLGRMIEEEPVTPPMDSSFEPPLGLNLEVVAEQSFAWHASPFRDRIREIIEEAGINARRHGHARHMSVRVIDHTTTVEVICRDDGKGLRGSSTPGLGSRLFDTAVGDTGSWSLQRQGIHTVAHFTLAKQVPTPA